MLEGGLIRFVEDLMDPSCYPVQVGCFYTDAQPRDATTVAVTTTTSCSIATDNYVDATREQKSEESFPPARQRPILPSDWPPQFMWLGSCRTIFVVAATCRVQQYRSMQYNMEAERYIYVCVHHHSMLCDIRFDRFPRTMSAFGCSDCRFVCDYV